MCMPFEAAKLAGLVQTLCVPPKPHYERGFSWDSKYKNTFDFRPSPIKYDRAFVDVLFENNIDKLIEEATLTRDIELVHCQVRYVERPDVNNTSYMAWHRDTYLTKDGWVGNTPPVNKLILYFEQGDPSHKLAVVRGSHRRMYDCQDMDCSKLLTSDADIFTFMSTPNTGIFFNTAILHHVIPEQKPQGSIRVIYSFATSQQFEKNYSRDNIHRECNSQYKKLRGAR